jgi:hypothetical protein
VTRNYLQRKVLSDEGSATLVLAECGMCSKTYDKLYTLYGENRLVTVRCCSYSPDVLPLT